MRERETHNKRERGEWDKSERERKKKSKELTTASVSTRMSPKCAFVTMICRSWCPRQVPQIGKGFPASLDSTAQL